VEGRGVVFGYFVEFGLRLRAELGFVRSGLPLAVVEGIFGAAVVDVPVLSVFSL